MEISYIQWCLAGLAAFLLGMSKSGIKGIGIFIVTLLALIFGSKSSTGILMPLLIVGDVFAVIYYHRHAQWKYIFILIPWMIIGVLLGVYFGKDLPEENFKRYMAIIIVLSVIIMYWLDRRKSDYVPQSYFFGSILGASAGFTTMIGNLGGAFSNLYFLVMRLPKNNFIGTAAYLFFIINLFKLPFHIFSWKTINIETLKINLILIPFQIVGLIAGVYVVKKINDAFYRKMILILTAVGAIAIFLK